MGSKKALTRKFEGLVEMGRDDDTLPELIDTLPELIHTKI